MHQTSHLAGPAASTATVFVVTNRPVEHKAASVAFERAATASSKVPLHGFELDLYRIPTRTEAFHDVLLGLLPSIANTSAASYAALIAGSLTNLKTIISTGIAGAVPNPRDPETHVRLGDLVVTGAGGTVQFDFRKLQEQPGGDPVVVPRHPPRPPSPYFLTAALRFQSESTQETQSWHEEIDETIGQLGSSFSRPSPSNDILYIDGHQVDHPEDATRIPGRPSLFIGNVGSSNTLLKHAPTRDHIREQYGIRAVEMEAAGVADAAWQNQVGYFSVRGTVDYCDIHKADVWHPYASAIAAALTCRLINQVPSDLTEATGLSGVSLYSSLSQLLNAGNTATESAHPTREDFDQGRIVAHPLQSKALSILRNVHFLGLVGPMGCGKSVLARALAISLEESGSICAFLPPDHVTEVLLPHLLTELGTLPQNTTLVLEDVHRDPARFNVLFEAAQSRGLDLIVTSRPSFYSEVHRHAPLTVATFLSEQNDSRLTLSAADVAPLIIDQWLVKHGAHTDTELREEFLSAAKNNLWALWFLLQHSTPDAPVNLHSAYASIVDVIEDAIPDSVPLQAYIGICLAYQFEIPLPASLLAQIAGAQLSDLAVLHRSGLITYHGATRTFSLPHAGQAQLSLDALDAHGHPILRELGPTPEHRAANVLCKFLEIQPAEITLVMRHIRNEPRFVEALSEVDTFRALANSFFADSHRSTWDLAHFLSDYTRVTNNVTRACAVASVDVNAAVRRLDSEPDLNAFAAFLDAFPWSVSQLAIPLVEEVNADMATMARNADEHERDDKVGFCRWMVASEAGVPSKADVAAVYQQFPSGASIPLERFSEERIGFCSKSSDTGKLIMCGKSMVSRPHVKSIDIVRALDSARLAIRLNEVSSAYTVAHVVDLLNWIDSTVARDVVCQMDEQSLRDHVAADGDPVAVLLKERLSKIYPELEV